MRKMTEARREAILAAAAQEFSECGYERASIAAIAARLGSSKPTIYRYFASKEELFAEVASRTADEMMEAAEAELMEGGDFVRNLQSYGERYLTFRQSPEAINLTRVAFGESGTSEVGGLVWKGARLHGLEKVGKILAEAMETGILRRADPSVAASHLFALLDAELTEAVVLRVREPASAKEITEVVARAIDVFVTAYQPTMGRTSAG